MCATIKASLCRYCDLIARKKNPAGVGGWYTPAGPKAVAIGVGYSPTPRSELLPLF